MARTRVTLPTIREGRIGQWLLAFMGLGFLLLVAAIAAAAWVQSRNEDHGRWVTHTYQVELAIAETRRLIEQGETTRRGYMLAPDIPAFLAAYHKTATALPGAMRRLNRLTADNPVQRRNNAILAARVREFVARRTGTIESITRGDPAEAVALFRGDVGAARMRTIRGIFDAMGAEERRLLAIRDAEQKRSVAIFYAVLVVAGVLLGLLAIVSLVAVLRYTRDLSNSRDTLHQLNDSLEAIVGDRTADLSRANEEIQRFAYIVSHDLRSPLVNVMGLTAELATAAAEMAALIDRAEAEAPQIVTEDARAAAREDLPEAIGFIRTSTQKMDRLINAILTLSRQGRRVLTPELFDVAAIVEGIRGSLAHRLDEQGADVIVEGDLPPIVCDRVAVEQILSNLIENAVKYAEPGRPVRVRICGGTIGLRVFYEVQDNGRGIDPRDHERVFDLFRRSGAQDQPGEGIGLAHVRAVAYRLGGNIDLRSKLGEGATFRLTLPQAMTDPQETRA